MEEPGETRPCRQKRNRADFVRGGKQAQEHGDDQSNDHRRGRKPTDAARTRIRRGQAPPAARRSRENGSEGFASTIHDSERQVSELFLPCRRCDQLIGNDGFHDG